MLLRCLLTGIYSFVYCCGSAQLLSIKGMIQGDNDMPIESLITLSRSDSILYSAASNLKGEFRIENIQQGNYYLAISSPSFISFEKSINLFSSKDIGVIKLQKEHSLNEVKIVSRKQLMNVKGDTVEYHANSIKMHLDGNTIDLLKKMPGVSIDNNSVSAVGNLITHVRVDGMPYYPSVDPFTALLNLPVDIIDKVQIYNDSLNRDQAINNGLSNTTINIITKDEKKNFTGKLFLGYGTDKRQVIGGTFDKFKGTQRINLVLQENNINIPDFSPHNNSLAGTNSIGISKSQSVGMNYSNTIKRKLDASIGYDFSKIIRTIHNEVEKKYLLFSDDRFYNETSSIENNSSSHRFNSRMKYLFDSSNSVTVKCQISYDQNTSNSKLNGATEENNISLNDIMSSIKSSSNNITYGSTVLYTHNFRKNNLIEIACEGLMNTNNSLNTTITETNVYTGKSDSFEQKMTFKKSNRNVKGSITYMQPLLRLGNLQLQYNLSKQSTFFNNESYKSIDGAVFYFDTIVSNKYKDAITTQKLYTGYNVREHLYEFSGGLNCEFTSLNNEVDLPKEKEVKREYKYLSPNVSLKINTSNITFINLNYSKSITLPNSYQLVDVIINSNPLQLYSGNPNLKPMVQHSFSVGFNTTHPSNALALFISFSSIYSRNYITSQLLTPINDSILKGGIILPRGGQLTMPINLSPYFSHNINVGVGLPIYSIKCNFNSSLFGGVSYMPGLINGTYTSFTIKKVGVNFMLSSNISEKIDFSLSSNTIYNNVTRMSNNSDDNIIQKNQIVADVMVYRDFILNSEIKYQYDNYQPKSQRNQFVWNFSIAKKIFKRKGDVRLSVVNVLNQTQNMQIVISESYASSIRSNNLQRYSLLSFSYKFR